MHLEAELVTHLLAPRRSGQPGKDRNINHLASELSVHLFLANCFNADEKLS